jgi:hypothetical protein
MIMSYLRMRADPLHSLDCSALARGCACSAVTALQSHDGCARAVRRRCVEEEESTVITAYIPDYGFQTS